METGPVCTRDSTGLAVVILPAVGDLQEIKSCDRICRVIADVFQSIIFILTLIHVSCTVRV